ncbi:hypothetical protein IAT38_005074 [Cryptococcus sp. DSM 104549]
MTQPTTQLDETAVDFQATIDAREEESYPYKRRPSWMGRLWDTYDRPPLERQLLYKVDLILLSFASVGYFLKNLDQTNINSAFLSGMKEDLGMYGNELVTAHSIWTVGYVLGQIPALLLLTRVEARWVIPTLELGWGLATLSSYSVTSFRSLYILRFFVGLFESGFYPGIHYLLGSWYTSKEIGKRAMIFWLSGSLGSIFSGILQAAAYTNLSGVYGLEGWRWLFIVDAIITLPLALLGFVFFPSSPLQDKKTWWLTDEEHTLSQTRLIKVGRAGKKPWTRQKVHRIFRSWHIYVLPFLYVIWNNAGAQNAVGYWLKSFNEPPYPGGDRRFSTQQINQLPLPQTGIFVVMAASWAWMSDGPLRGSRWPFFYIGAVLGIFFALLFRNFPLYDNPSLTLVLYWFSSIGNGAGPLILTFINEICSDDTEKRALLVSAANDLAYVVQAIMPNFVWKTTEFPQAKTGWTYSLWLNILLIFWTTLVLLLLRRDRRRKAAQQLAHSSDSAYQILEDGPEYRYPEDPESYKD